MGDRESPLLSTNLIIQKFFFSQIQTVIRKEKSLEARLSLLELFQTI